MQGLMQDFPLTVPHLFQRAEKLFPGKEIVTAGPAGTVRITYGSWAHRTRRLAGALDDLGISPDGRVATLC
jgi:fatty-acyl-CoA synthase